MSSSHPTPQVSRRFGIAGFLAVALILLASGVGFYRHKARDVYQEQHQILAAIGDLKTSQIQTWRKERLRDIRRGAQGPIFRQRTAEFLGAGGAVQVQADLLKMLAINRMEGFYSASFLLRLDGKVLLSTGDAAEVLNPATRLAMTAVLATQEPHLSDFFRHADGVAHVDSVAAVPGPQGQSIAVLILRTNVDDNLFPLVQTWPLPNVSAESVLVVRSGDEAIVPHRLRHQAEGAPHWHEPLTRTDFPAVQAVLGKQGFFDGKDYRGKGVLADLRGIPGSPWFMVTKLDQDESLAHLRLDALFIGAITLAFILLAGAGFGYFYRVRQAKGFKALYEAERENLEVEQSLRTSEQRLQLALAATKQGFYDLNVQTGESTISEEYARMLGFEPGAFRETHESWLENLHPEDREEAEAAFKGYLAGERQEYRIEFRQRTRDGGWKWILSLGKILETTADGKPLRMLGTRTDITELKQGQEALKASEKWLLHTQRIAGLGSYRLNIPTGRWTSSEVLDDLLGIEKAADHPVEQWLALIHPESREIMSHYLAEVVIAKRQPFNLEYKIVRERDGAERWMHGMGELELDAQGEPLLLIGSILDITERKEAELSLRSTRNQVTQLLQTTDEGIFGINSQGACTFINAAALQLLGLNSEDCVGRNMHDLIHHSHADGSAYPGATCPIFRSRSTGVGVRVDHEVFWRQDGSFFPAEYSSHPIFEEGEIRGAVVTFADISERKAAEETLRKAEQRFRDLVDSTDGIVWEADAFTLVFTSVSGNAERMLGYPITEWLQPGFWAGHLHPDDRDQAIQYRVACTGRWEDHDFEYRFLARDGKTVWLRDIVKVVTETDQHRWLRGLLVDITAQKLAEEALRTSEREFRELLENLPVGVLVYSPEVELLDCNPMATKLLGIHLEQAKYQTPEHLVWRSRIREDGSPLPLAEYPMSQVAASGQAVHGLLNGVIVEGAPEPIWLQADGFPVYDADHVLRRIVVTFVDITGVKQAEARQRDLEHQLQQSQKMESLGLLAGGVAHDMNNVLAAILGLSTAHLEIQPASSPAYRAFDTIVKACVRGGKLVKGLLGISRKGLAEEGELDLNALVREEVHLLERTTLSRVRLEMDLEPDLPAIRGDAGALSHALMNLCVNAVDALPENGRLALHTRRLGDHVEIEVEDSGIGMSKEVLDRALEPFFTTKPQGKGTGLGLSMVYSTVKAHRGGMEIISSPGHGTRILLRFPTLRTFTPIPEADSGRITQSLVEEGSSSLHILLVDDDELVSASVEELIELLGHTVTLVHSGEEAMVKLEAGLVPQVVILDLNMPGMGGAGTLPLLRQLRPKLPVLLATGRVEQTALDLVNAHRGVTLMSKPFTMDELREHLRRFTSQSMDSTPPGEVP